MSGAWDWSGTINNFVEGTVQDRQREEDRPQKNLQMKLKNIVELGAINPQAAVNAFNNDQELVKAGGGPISHIGEKEDWSIFQGSDGVYSINKKNGQSKKLDIGEVDPSKKPGSSVTGTWKLDDGSEYHWGGIIGPKGTPEHIHPLKDEKEDKDKTNRILDEFTFY